MTVALVLVSHVAEIAEGVRRLVAQMAPDVTIGVAGGDDEGGVGTSFDKVLAALEEVRGDDGVAVLYDLGSALLTAETAVEMLADEGVVIVDAPLVEGALAAATAAQQGDDLATVTRVAAGQGRGDAAAAAADTFAPGTESLSESVTLPNPLGLHARPAADLARLLGGVDARVLLAGETGAWVDARSVVAVIGLGLRGGDTVRLAAEGADASSALERVVDLLEAGFGETGDAAPGAISGVSGAPGVGEGRAVLVAPIAAEEREAATTEEEQQRLDEAIAEAQRQLDAADDVFGPIAAAHHTLVGDPMLRGRAGTLVGEGRSADDAWRGAVDEAYAVLSGVADAEMALRAADVLDVGARVTACLQGRDFDAGLPDRHAIAGAVLVTDEALPSQVVMAHRAGASGLVAARGGPSAHAAQLARALGLPAVLGAGDAVRRIAAGTRVRVDGDRGLVEVH